MPARTRRLALLGCLLIGLCLRGLRWVERPFIHPDSPGYIEMAGRLDAAHWPTAFTGYYPPGYPLALRAAHGLGMDWESAGRAVALAAGTATVPLAGVLGGVLGPEVGIGAAALAAVHPSMVRASAEVLPETLYGLVIVVWALLLVGDPVTSGRAAAAGFVGALASLVRAEGLALVPLTAFAAGASVPAGARVRRVLLVAGAAAIVIVPLAVLVPFETGTWAISGKEAPMLARRYGVDGTSLLGLAVRHPGTLLGTYPLFLGRHLGYTLATANLLLLLPIGLGLTASLPHRAAGHLRRLVVATVAVFTLAIALVAPGKRYVIPLVPLLLPWAVLGARRLTALASGGALGRVGKTIANGAPIVAGLVLAVLVAGALKRPEQLTSACFHGACAWVAEHFGTPPPAIITDDGRIAYVCGARFVQEPQRGGTEAVVARARATGARLWIVKQWHRAPPPLVDGVVPVAQRCGRGIAIFEIRAP